MWCVTAPPYGGLSLTSWFTHRTLTLGPPLSATVFTSGSNAPVVIRDAPATIEMSAAVGVGGGGLVLVLVGVELLQAAASMMRSTASDGGSKACERLEWRMTGSVM